jgi:hypothetical protein
MGMQVPTGAAGRLRTPTGGFNSHPSARHATVARKALLAGSGASCEACARDPSRAEEAGKTCRAGGYAKGVGAKCQLWRRALRADGLPEF